MQLTDAGLVEAGDALHGSTHIYNGAGLAEGVADDSQAGPTGGNPHGPHGTHTQIPRQIQPGPHAAGGGLSCGESLDLLDTPHNLLPTMESPGSAAGSPSRSHKAHHTGLSYDSDLYICDPRQLHTIEVDLDMMRYMLRREKDYQPGHYLSFQNHVDANMRAILFDWMMEVSQEFGLGRECMYLAANYVDRYLCKSNGGMPLGTYQKTSWVDDHASINAQHPITRSDLQLLGVSCLFLASKLEEIYPPNAGDFSVTTDGGFTANQIAAMERRVLYVLNWNLHTQTPFSWLRMYCQYAAKLVSQSIRSFPADPAAYPAPCTPFTTPHRRPARTPGVGSDGKLLVDGTPRNTSLHYDSPNATMRTADTSSSGATVMDTRSPSSSPSGHSLPSPISSSLNLSTSSQQSQVGAQRALLPNGVSSSNRRSSSSRSGDPGMEGPSDDDRAKQALLVALLSCENFTRMAEPLDICLLDARVLQFYPSALAASTLCLVLPEAVPLLKSVTGYDARSLAPCIDMLQQYLILPGSTAATAPRTTNPYFNQKVIEEPYTRQTHSPKFLTLLREVQWQRQRQSLVEYVQQKYRKQISPNACFMWQ
eukprot:g11701.t1